MNLYSAASQGLVKDITEICQTPNGKKDLNQEDKENETPLWKAIRANSMEAVVALVAFGAKINIQNKERKTPIHLALENKNIEMFKFLFCFGGHRIQFDMIDEWECRDRFLEEDVKIIKTFAEYCCQQQKFSYGYRKSGVLYRVPGETFKENEIAEIELDENNTDTHVFVTCLTDTPDKLYFHGRMRENQQPFSDIYEFRAYATKHVSCCIKLKITDAPSSNEELSIKCFEGNCYQKEGTPIISGTDQDKVTEYKVHLDLKSGGCVKFAVVKSAVTEIFTVTEKQKSLTLNVISEAKIDMPPDTGSAQVAVSATKTEESNMEDQKIICSDVLHIEIHGKKSRKDGIIHLPLHTNLPTDSDVEHIGILVSNVLKPDKASDWQICKSGILTFSDGKLQFHSTFDFKCCVAVLKQCFDSAKSQVIRAIRGENDVNIFAMLRQQENEYSLIVEFALLKSFEEKKMRWENKGYRLESFKRKSVQKNKPYMISFSGKIEVRGWTEDESIITYLPKKENQLFQEYHLISSSVDGKVIKPAGQAYIGRPVFPSTSDTMLGKLKAIFKNDIAPKNFEDITYLPIGEQEDVTDVFNAKAEGGCAPALTKKVLKEDKRKAKDTKGSFRCSVIDRVVRIVHRHPRYSVSQVIKGGSLGKGTGVKGHSDVDLLVVLNDFKNVDELAN
ncbi:unnamed protein product [Mytilus coruscus]|uniref:Polymerase nucleotidyl transferase domain-containing protein n=1 Tax=Mytilus coruscus TaxID=42192 RepID=A0A6J8EXF5_MYTCO|nr:unnamed protein product [Mytilus coruscus]